MAEKVLTAQSDIKQTLVSNLAKGFNSMGALAIVIGLVTALFLYNAVKIDSLSSDVNQRIDNLATEMNRRFDAMEQRFESVNQRFESVNQRFEAVDKRLDRIEKAILTLTHEIRSSKR